MTDAEFLRLFPVGIGAGFLLGMVVTGYVALGFRERLREAAIPPRLQLAEKRANRLCAARRRKRHFV